MHTEGPRKEITGSRAAQPQDDAFVSSDSRSERVEVLLPGERHKAEAPSSSRDGDEDDDDEEGVD